MAAKQGKTLSSNTMNLKFMRRQPAASPKPAAATEEAPFPAQSTSKQASNIRHEASYSAFPCLLIAYPRQAGSQTSEQSGRKSFGVSKGKAKAEPEEPKDDQEEEEDADSSDDVSTTLRGEAKRKRELNPAAARTIKHHLPAGYAKPKGFEDVKANKEFADGQIAEARAKRKKTSKADGIAID